MNSKQIFNIEGKITLVTGSTGGIGHALALGLCENGATVILNGRDKKKLEQQVKEFKDAGYNVHGACFDITDSQQINEAVEDINKNIGAIDVLINNAGITVRAPLEDFKDSDWDAIININLTGAYKMSKAVVKE